MPSKGQAHLRVRGQQPVPDTTPPEVTITEPAPNAVITGDSVTIRGTATDDRAVAAVEVSMDGGPYEPATGTTSWFRSYSTLAAQVHTALARARDTSSNYSSARQRVFTTRAIQPQPLTLSSFFGGNYIGRILRRLVSQVTPQSSLTLIINEMETLYRHGVNFLRIPVYWSVAEPNMTQYLIEVENITREAGRRGMVVQWTDHQFHTGPDNGGDGFPRTWTQNYPPDTSISKVSDRMWEFWQAVIYDEIPGFREAWWTFKQKVYDAASRGNDFKNWRMKEYLNEPQVSPGKFGETAVQVARRYRTLYEWFEERFKARYGNMPTVMCEANRIGPEGIGGLMPSVSQQHEFFPRNCVAGVVYASHRYNHSPPDDTIDRELTVTVPTIVNNAKNSGINMLGAMHQEWNVGGSGLPDSYDSMLLYMQKLKQYNFGWTIWAMMGGSNSRNVFVEDSSSPTGWKPRPGVGEWFFQARKAVYNF